MDKLLCRHEVDYLQKRVNIKEIKAFDIEFEVGPNLVRCQTVKDVDFLIEPQRKRGKRKVWVIL